MAAKEILGLILIGVYL